MSVCSNQSSQPFNPDLNQSGLKSCWVKIKINPNFVLHVLTDRQSAICLCPDTTVTTPEGKPCPVGAVVKVHCNLMEKGIHVHVHDTQDRHVEVLSQCHEHLQRQRDV